MADRNCRVRFAGNDLTQDTEITLTASSADVSFPLTNLQLPQRYKQWRSAGNFDITATNNKIYVTDGIGSQTVTLTIGSYLAAALATELKTQLDAGTDRTWTTSYLGAEKFELIASASSTLEFSNQTNAVWDTLGFVGASDITSTLFTADERRIHTSETITWDLLSQREVNFFGGVGPRDEIFSISEASNITLKANNINDFTAPPLSRTIDRKADGLFTFLDDLDDTSYRYWQLEIEDKQNLLGVAGIQLGTAYLGDYITLTQRNVTSGFGKQWVDPSEVVVAESGAKFFRERQKFLRFSSLGIPFLNATDRATLEQFIFDKGIHGEFFISLDPTLFVSTELTELTRYVRFSSAPTLQHNKADVYSLQFAVEEII